MADDVRSGGSTVAQATLTIHSPDVVPDETAVGHPSGRRRRWIAPAVLLLCSAVVWFAPGVAARTGLRHRIIHVAVPQFPGTASVGSASLGWTSPVVLDDVRLFDEQGRELLRIEELRTSIALASIVSGSGDDLGVITLKRPQAMIALRPDGSNLEDVLEPILAATGPSSGMTVRIEEGDILWTTVEGEPSPGGIENVAATIVRSPASSWPTQLDCTGQATNGEHAGPFSIRVRPNDEKEAAARTEIAVVASNLPLAPFQAWLDRFSLSAEVVGNLSADLVASAAAVEPHDWQVGGRIEGRHLRITRPDWSLHDRLLLESVVVAGRAEQSGDELLLEGVRLQSDLCNVTSTGRFDVSGFRDAAAWQHLADSVFASDATISGTIDLTKLAAALPQTVRLKEPIKSGSLDISLQTSGDELVRVAAVRVHASDIVAGSTVWPRPLAADLVIRRDANGFEAEQIRAVGEFLSVQGSASSRGADIQFEADLATLQKRLARLIELPAASLGGQVTGQIRLVRGSDQDRLRIEVQGAVRNLNLKARSLHWAERELVITASANALLENSQPTSINAGGLTIRGAEGDELTLALVEPVAVTRDVHDATWPISLKVKGEASRWLDRARALSMLSSTSAWDLAGTVDAHANLQFGSDRVGISGAVIELAEARLQIAGRSFDEPRIRLAGNAVWRDENSTLSFSKAELTSDTLVLDIEELRLPLAGSSMPEGRVRFRGGIGRVIRYAMPERPPVWLSGVARGTVALLPSATRLDARATIELERPVLTRPVTSAGGGTTWQTIWSDQNVTVNVESSYQTEGQRLDLHSLKLAATGISLAASGRIDRLATTADAQLSGTLAYELEALRARFAAAPPGDFNMSGKGSKPFFVRGSLAAVGDGLTGQMGFGWERLDAFGLTIGAADVSGTLERQRLRIVPIDWPVSGGRLRGTAAISLAASPMLTIGRGRVVDNVSLTPELTRRWIQYAAPTLADAAVVEGRISLDVTNCTIPLEDTTHTQAAGVLDIGNATATAGSLARSLVSVVGQIQAVLGRESTDGSDLKLIVPPQRVNVKIERGRVIHDRLIVRLGDGEGLMIASSGSVGFDESLDLVVDVPLEVGWFKDERIAQSLGGQILRIPVRGTLKSPMPDPRALQELARKAAVGAASGFLNREFEKQLGDPLRKLFDQ